jgi:hypothetical protein
MAARLMWRSGGGRGALQRGLKFSSSSAAVGPAAEISAAASTLQPREFNSRNLYFSEWNFHRFLGFSVSGVYLVIFLLQVTS